MGADDSNHPELAEARAWALAHRDLLQRVFERFDETGDWPQLEDLQHDFTVGGRDDIDVATTAFAMPRPLGFVQQGQLILLTRGLSYVESAVGLLDIWAAALRIACQRWIHDHKTAWLTREDVEKLTHGNRHQTDLVSALLLRERWAFGDGRGSPTDDWKQKIIESVRIARHTRDAQTLLEKREAVEFPEPATGQVPVINEPKPELSAPVTETSAGSSGPSPHFEAEASKTFEERLRRFFRDPIVIAVVAGLLVILISGIVSDGFKEVFSGGGSSPTTKGPRSTGQQEVTGEEAQLGEGTRRFKETAGEGGASTYANPHTLSEPGESVEPGQTVKVICRVYAPEPPSVNPDGYWYRLSSSPWKGKFFAPANSFWNGDVPGRRPYTHNTDKRVPVCHPPGITQP